MEIENTYIVVRTRAELMVAAKFYAMHGLRWNNGGDLVGGHYTERAVRLPAKITKSWYLDGLTWGSADWVISDRKEIPIKQAALSLFYES